MVEISRFYGIVIYMYCADHLPPHFHANYNDQSGVFSVQTGEYIDGNLNRRNVRLVQAWYELNSLEIQELHKQSQSDKPIFHKIKPL